MAGAGIIIMYDAKGDDVEISKRVRHHLESFSFLLTFLVNSSWVLDSTRTNVVESRLSQEEACQQV